MLLGSMLDHISKCMVRSSCMGSDMCFIYGFSIPHSYNQNFSCLDLLKEMDFQKLHVLILLMIDLAKSQSQVGYMNHKFN